MQPSPKQLWQHDPNQIVSGVTWEVHNRSKADKRTSKSWGGRRGMNCMRKTCLAKPGLMFEFDVDKIRESELFSSREDTP